MASADQLELFQGPPAGKRPDPEAPLPTPTGFIPTQAPPSLPPNAKWREIATPTQPIGFVLLRCRRKSIGLVVNDDGLHVRAPHWATLSQIDAAVREKSPWILRKLKVRQTRQRQLATAETQWQDGGVIPYLGARVVIALDGGAQATRFQGEDFRPVSGDVLRLALPADADRERVRDCTHGWLQQQAAEWLDQRLRYFLDVGQQRIRRWRLSSASTRWGSCSSDGSIMLNWRLIHFQHEIIDYVIAHEVAHLREMNHSPAFWREVGRLFPGFEPFRDALRQHSPGTLPLL